MGIKFSHFTFKDTVKNNIENKYMPSEGWSYLGGGGNLRVQVCVKITIRVQSEESDFATVAGSTAKHLLSSMADKWYAASQLQSTSLKGFLQSLSTASPFCSTLYSIPLSRS